MDFTLKFLLILSLFALASVFWQNRTRAAWSSFLFGFLAFGIHFSIRMLLEQFFPRLFDPLEGALLFGDSLWSSWMTQFFLAGLLRESVRWLTLRHIATSVRSWQDGVFFGIGYSTLTTIITLSEQFRSLLWGSMLGWVYIHVIILTVFNAGTCLAVLYSVQKRQVWFLLIAVVLYMIKSSPSLVVLLYFDDVQIGGLEPQASLSILLFLANAIAVLPPFWLAFSLRKPMGE